MNVSLVGVLELQIVKFLRANRHRQKSFTLDLARNHVNLVLHRTHLSDELKEEIKMG